MRTMALQISAWGIAVTTASILSASGATAAETWLQCEGTVATVGADGKPLGEAKPAKDVYVHNDETRNFFRYAETRKALDLVFVTDYGQTQIKWGSPAGSSYGDVQWQGVLDRGVMTLKLTRKEKGETMTWSESRKQIQPMSSSR